MGTFLVLAFLFFLGSLIGWVLELFYRRIVGKKWINPGFLKGPYLPIYGLGLVFMFVVCAIDFSFVGNAVLEHIIKLIVMGAVMTLIEFIGGLIFIKGMNIKLWDYSMRKGNIMGIICPTFSIIWTAIGALYFYVLHPYVIGYVTWFVNNIEFSFVVGAFFGLFIADLVTTLNLSIKIAQYAKELDLVVKYENFKADIKERTLELKQKYGFKQFLNPIHGDIREHLRKYDERRKSKINELKNKINKNKK